MIEPDPKLLEALICPVCKTALHYDRSAGELISKEAGLAFPVRDGVPVLLRTAARLLPEAETNCPNHPKAGEPPYFSPATPTRS